METPSRFGAARKPARWPDQRLLPKSASAPKEFDLLSVHDGSPMLTKPRGLPYAEAASVCLEHNKHGLSIAFSVTGYVRRICNFRRLNVDEGMRRAWGDMKVTAEWGAYCIAFIILRETKNLFPLTKSRTGTGFDYWMGDRNDIGFQGKARLEVSGILDGSEGQIAARRKKKLRQTKQSDALKIPAIIVIVEFKGLTVQTASRVSK